MAVSRIIEAQAPSRLFGAPLRTTALLGTELEAPPGFEPGMEVLQTSALPLGDGA